MHVHTIQIAEIAETRNKEHNWRCFKSSLLKCLTSQVLHFFFLEAAAAFLR